MSSNPARNCCLILIVASLLLGGCAFSTGPVRHVERLQPEWVEGKSWSVRHTVWPSRMKNPATPADTAVHAVFKIRVKRAEPEHGRYILEAWDGIERYRLNIIDGAILDSVKRVLGHRDQALKVEVLYKNRFRRGPLYLLEDPDPQTGLWFFPSLDGTALQSWQRYPVLSSQRSTGRWVDQKAVKTEGGIRFVFRNEDGTERVVLLWKKGKPWWSKLTWSRHGRIIGRSVLRKESVSNLPGRN